MHEVRYVLCVSSKLSLVELDLRDTAAVGQGLALDGVAHLLGNLA